ncbi:MAG: TolC family protein, partial [Anaerolineales bacterium]|nr:TolC family protein [Anaerolineales bacterium]
RGESSYNRRVYGDGRRIDRKVICQQKQIGADILEQQAIEFLRDVVEHSNGKEELNVLQKQIKAAEDRLERARELYLAGEINRLNYNEERSRLESLEKDLHYNTIGATMTSLGVIRSGIAEWNDLSQIEQKRLLRLAVEAAWVRENAVVAVQPSIAFLSLLSGENGNMGNIGIRTRG